MKALTLFQPWASLIAARVKQHETRTFKPPAGLIGERVAIHAGQTLLLEAGNELGPILHREFGERWAFELPRGAVLATATLAGCYPTKERLNQITAEDWICGDWTPGRWAWHLTDVTPLPKPVPCPGKRSLWEWDGSSPTEESP